MGNPLQREFIRRLDEDRANQIPKDQQALLQRPDDPTGASSVPNYITRIYAPAYMGHLDPAECHTAVSWPDPSRPSFESDPAIPILDAAVRRLVGDMRRVVDPTSPSCRLLESTRVILGTFWATSDNRYSVGWHFSVNHQDETDQKYENHMVSLILFVYRCWGPRPSPFTPHPDPEFLPPPATTTLTPRQVDALAGTVDSVCQVQQSQPPCEDHRAAEDTLQRYILELLVALHHQASFGNLYRECPLASWFVLKAKGRDGAWLQAGVLSSRLSVLVWNAQLLTFYRLAILIPHHDHNLLPRLQEDMKEFFWNTSTISPVLARLNLLRLVLFRAARMSGPLKPAIWMATTRSINFGPTSLVIPDDPQAWVRYTYDRARHILGDLVFQNPQADLDSRSLDDDTHCKMTGWSFLNFERNAPVLGNHTRLLLDTIANNQQYLDNWVSGNPATFTLKFKTWYEREVKDFLQHLLVLIHITANAPLRASEILSIMWCNTAAQRHVMVPGGQVHLITYYSKRSWRDASDSPNVRILPPWVGDLLIQFLVFVNPFREIIRRADQATSDFLSIRRPLVFADIDATSEWPNDVLSKTMQQTSLAALRKPVNSSTWRHIIAALIKGYMSLSDAQVGLFNLPPTTYCAGEFEEELDLHMQDAASRDQAELHLQMNHSVATAYHNYATTGNSDLFHRGTRTSALYQRFFGFDEPPSRPVQRKRQMSHSESNRSMVRGLATYEPPEIQAACRRLFNNPEWDWTCPEQEQWVTNILGPSPPHNLLGILPTGLGKTLPILLLGVLKDAKVNIVLVPTVALMNDYRHRLRMHAIPFFEWVGRDPPRHLYYPLVLVAAENIPRQQFRTYLSVLINADRLGRCFFDECHLSITQGFRRDLRTAFANLSHVPTQRVAMTATLPPTWEQLFLDNQSMDTAKIQRASVVQPTLRYDIFVHKERSSTLTFVAQMLRSRPSWPAHIRAGFIEGRDKVLVFCLTRTLTENLARLLGAPHFHAQIGTPAVKSQRITEWTQDPGSTFMVATDALGCGFDHPFIHWVIFLERPRSMTAAVQQGGRAGRNGRPGFVTVFTSLVPQPIISFDNDEYPPPPEDVATMDLWLKNQACLRQVASVYLDGPSLAVDCATLDARCPGRNVPSCGFCDPKDGPTIPSSLVLAPVPGPLPRAVPGPQSPPADAPCQPHVTALPSTSAIASSIMRKWTSAGLPSDPIDVGFGSSSPLPSSLYSSPTPLPSAAPRQLPPTTSTAASSRSTGIRFFPNSAWPSTPSSDPLSDDIDAAPPLSDLPAMDSARDALGLPRSFGVLQPTQMFQSTQTGSSSASIPMGSPSMSLEQSSSRRLGSSTSQSLPSPLQPSSFVEKPATPAHASQFQPPSTAVSRPHGSSSQTRPLPPQTPSRSLKGNASCSGATVQVPRTRESVLASARASMSPPWSDASVTIPDTRYSETNSYPLPGFTRPVHHDTPPPSTADPPFYGWATRFLTRLPGFRISQPPAVNGLALHRVITSYPLAIKNNCFFCRADGNPRSSSHGTRDCRSVTVLQTRRLKDIGKTHINSLPSTHPLLRVRTDKRGARYWWYPWSVCSLCFYPPRKLWWCRNPHFSDPQPWCIARQDAILPLVAWAWFREGGKAWFLERYGKTFASDEEFTEWLGSRYEQKFHNVFQNLKDHLLPNLLHVALAVIIEFGDAELFNRIEVCFHCSLSLLRSCSFDYPARSGGSLQPLLSRYTMLVLEWKKWKVFHGCYGAQVSGCSGYIQVVFSAVWARSSSLLFVVRFIPPLSP